MEKLDLQIAETEEQFTDPEIFQDHERLLPLQQHLEELKGKHEETMALWLQLQEKLEQINN